VTPRAETERRRRRAETERRRQLGAPYVDVHLSYDDPVGLLSHLQIDHEGAVRASAARARQLLQELHDLAHPERTGADNTGDAP
jgi:hypothetical protein